MKWGILLVCAAGFLLPSRAQAEVEKSMIIYGAGSYSCTSWVEERKKNLPIGQSVFAQWLLGYVSAAGTCLNLEHGDSNSFLTWMDTWCSEHPIEGIVDGAAVLVENLHQRQAAKKAIPHRAPKRPRKRPVMPE